ncbi:hypothetical protein FEM48_Zijuj07G0070500 [Ziziphus jujuba var. spinosa]|uniref:F-box protein PP2-B12 n=1 Tax=Ziziphus jujuba var. spinosa TaxID=714518 RepID=A0A978V365_ZIZJJ|nr:F-box protein At2g02240-like [Ziziphus jujuba var. spinosa]KAH7521798.1 hypothetical protein FEM48_Zijuj07G0070500 [Ziziphus jujuba var. spinosa]
MDSLSTKQLFLHLSHHPALVDDGNMMYRWLDMKCYMIGARSRSLLIVWACTPSYWQWMSLPALSRFSEVAELNHVWWFEIKGRIETNILSPQTNYAVYFVYKLKQDGFWFYGESVTVQVNFEGDEEIHGKGYGSREVLLGPPENKNKNMQQPCGAYREDGWMEVELGEFFNDGEENHGVLTLNLMDINPTEKYGIIVEGIELRPKAGG